jgi:uncharacterized protein (DUF302 family)
MKFLCLFLAIISFQACASVATKTSNLVTHKSQYFHDKTVKMIKKFLKKKKLKVFSVIDHHKGAKKVKLNLDKTTLIIFGNPKVGTLMMQENQLIGIDLPLKILVHTKSNLTHMTYKKISLLKDEYNLSSNLDSKVSKIETLFENVVEYVTKEDESKKKK